MSNPGALAAAPPASVTRPRARLLLFRGALSKQDLAPGAGQAIRGAMQQLAARPSNDSLIVDVRRMAATQAKASPAQPTQAKGAHRGGRGAMRLDFTFNEDDYSGYGVYGHNCRWGTVPLLQRLASCA